MRIHAGDIGADLYRVQAPDGGPRPRIDRRGGDVTMVLPSGSGRADQPVDVVVNADVQWALRLAGGTKQTVIDMAEGDVSGIELAGGAARIELTLPRPAGVVPVRMSGGVERFVVHVAGPTPVRVRAFAGAGQITVGGTTHRGVAPGRSFGVDGWAEGSAGLDVQALAGMSSLDVVER